MVKKKYSGKMPKKLRIPKNFFNYSKVLAVEVLEIMLFFLLIKQEARRESAKTSRPAGARVLPGASVAGRRRPLWHAAASPARRHAPVSQKKMAFLKSGRFFMAALGCGAFEVLRKLWASRQIADRLSQGRSASRIIRLPS